MKLDCNISTISLFNRSLSENAWQNFSIVIFFYLQKIFFVTVKKIPLFTNLIAPSIKINNSKVQEPFHSNQ